MDDNATEDAESIKDKVVGFVVVDIVTVVEVIVGVVVTTGVVVVASAVDVAIDKVDESISETFVVAIEFVLFILVLLLLLLL